MLQKKIKTAIVLLAVLLALSLAALAGVLIYRATVPAVPSTVTVPDNIVTPDADVSSIPETPQSNYETSSNTNPSSATEANNSTQSKTATALSLNNRNTDDNMPFQVGNMFPGDSETKYYCVRVSHKGDVILRFRADIRPGYEQL